MYYDRPRGYLDVYDVIDKAEQRRSYAPPRVSEVEVPTRTHRPIPLPVNTILSVGAYFFMMMIGMLVGAGPVASMSIGLVVAFTVFGRNLIHNVRGDARVTMTRARAKALAYFDDLPDEDVIAAVDAYRDAKAKERQAKIDEVWEKYRAHAASPIAQLDPDSWNARRRELTKALTDLGEKVPTDG